MSDQAKPQATKAPQRPAHLKLAPRRRKLPPPPAKLGVELLALSLGFLIVLKLGIRFFLADLGLPLWQDITLIRLSTLLFAFILPLILIYVFYPKLFEAWLKSRPAFAEYGLAFVAGIPLAFLANGINSLAVYLLKPLGIWRFFPEYLFETIDYPALIRSHAAIAVTLIVLQLLLASVIFVFYNHRFLLPALSRDYRTDTARFLAALSLTLLQGNAAYLITYLILFWCMNRLQPLRGDLKPAMLLVLSFFAVQDLLLPLWPAARLFRPSFVLHVTAFADLLPLILLSLLAASAFFPVWLPLMSLNALHPLYHLEEFLKQNTRRRAERPFAYPLLFALLVLSTLI